MPRHAAPHRAMPWEEARTRDSDDHFVRRGMDPTCWVAGMRLHLRIVEAVHVRVRVRRSRFARPPLGDSLLHRDVLDRKSGPGVVVVCLTVCMAGMDERPVALLPPGLGASHVPLEVHDVLVVNTDLLGGAPLRVVRARPPSWHSSAAAVVGRFLVREARRQSGSEDAPRLPGVQRGVYGEDGRLRVLVGAGREGALPKLLRMGSDALPIQAARCVGHGKGVLHLLHVDRLALHVVVGHKEAAHWHGLELRERHVCSLQGAAHVVRVQVRRQATG
mmetsp:Transcript_41486/g.123954  ORF Transcript_41486/g.123954 Transcript_41486/m.123954 type:complete len:275 (+) Transcript_41486:32-856(+)